MFYKCMGSMLFYITDLSIYSIDVHVPLFPLLLWILSGKADGVCLCALIAVSSTCICN